MGRGAARTWATFVRRLVVALITLTAGVAAADGRVTFLAERLKTADDFRVRANAALALGNTNDDSAVPPLCGGIGDSNEIVRKASAVALERLKRASSLDCLRRRVAVEKDGSVKLQIQRAIDATLASSGSSGGSSAPPPTVANAKYYVALSPVTNNTSRSQADVTRVIHDAIKSKLSQLGGYQIAPSGEAPAAAKAELSKRSLKGYYLSIVVDKFDYSGGNLHVSIKVAVSTYPSKDLRGELSKGATIGGASPASSSRENR